MSDNLIGTWLGLLLVNISFLISTIIIFKDDINNPVWTNIIFSLVIEILSVVAIFYWGSLK